MDQYDLHAILGFGSFSVVKAATDRSTDAPVALKMVRFRKESERAALLAEGQLWAQLHHPNICPLLNLFTLDAENNEPGGTVVFVMPWAKDGDLLTALSSKKAVSPITVLRALCAALSYLHTAKGMIHGDVKLENILLSENGTILLADFGYLNRLDDNHKDSAQIFGSLEYAAPEMLQVNEHQMRLTTAIDVWATGIVLYALLEKKFPFDGHSSRFIKAKILHEDPVLAKVNENWRPILMKLLEKDPKKRIAIEDVGPLETINS